jgi:hypothetical protein
MQLGTDALPVSPSRYLKLVECGSQVTAGIGGKIRSAQVYNQ